MCLPSAMLTRYNNSSTSYVTYVAVLIHSWLEKDPEFLWDNILFLILTLFTIVIDFKGLSHQIFCDSFLACMKRSGILPYLLETRQQTGLRIQSIFDWIWILLAFTMQESIQTSKFFFIIFSSDIFMLIFFTWKMEIFTWKCRKVLF